MSRRSAQYFRPSLEALEDRQLLSSSAISNPGNVPVYFNLQSDSHWQESVGKVHTTRAPVCPPHPPAPWWMAWGFRLLVAAHGLLVVGFALSFVVLPFRAPWYVALPLMTFMFSFTTTRVECQLTNLENYLRLQLGKRRIRGFVGHYFLRPARKLWAQLPPTPTALSARSKRAVCQSSRNTDPDRGA